ncbi:von Willebrand factor A domain-containing protein 8 [Contarinia nasturtii]|uniref:von Willebrand factor A domain-containing protein 8 n=1 Tax=Contarinia nasturtii TaxID=265458 RepID=UPI0012D427DC|nr:von Willebrand factor A domain-containing protein 8 [Contarinia nasturtii]
MSLNRMFALRCAIRTNVNWRLRSSNFRPIYRTLATDGKITIDGISKDLIKPKNPLFVPQKFLKLSQSEQIVISQTVLHHLRWMLQKDLLGQDIFLIGRPGPLRRSIVMQFLELTQRELEYVALSRDTTENDLKQRREIQNGTAVYFDQSAVRAAIHGRVLVIEGIEKAERNVLPVLNNLLENREMHLEDGRFLIPASRFDKLKKEHGSDELKRWGLVRVSENFRVIALGLPVPKYRGVPLDPPLRSRFQARDITSTTYQETMNELRQLAPEANEHTLEKITSFGYAIQNTDETPLTKVLPDFPCDNLKLAAQINQANPSTNPYQLLYRLYPFDSFLPKECHGSLMSLFDSLNIALPSAENNKSWIRNLIQSNGQRIVSIERPTLSEALLESTTSLQYHKVTIESNGEKCSIKVPGGTTATEIGSQFVETNYQNYLLSEIIQSYAVGDICLIGARGSGKSILIEQIAQMLNQHIEPMVLYQDMTARDFVQQRATTPKGDTVWRDSPMIRAAKAGTIAVLDGIHRIHNSTISVLHRLIHDREIQLYDGTRLIRHEAYDELLSNGQTKEELANNGIFRIHPSFRIVALAEPPSVETGKNWLSPEVLSLFLFHEIRNLSKEEEKHIIQSLYGEINESMDKILNLAELLRKSKDPIVRNLSTTLSTRQLLRIAHRMSAYPPNEACAYEIVQQTFLAKFLPSLPRAALENAIKNVSISPPKTSNLPKASIKVDNGMLTIGSTSTSLYKTQALTKVPDIVFFDVPQHVEILERLLQDFLIGNHLLLVGNQGVGKNKVVDRLLQLMNRPREYIQLHRDTTVQSLTTQPSVVDGVVVYEDSPLVKAVRMGHVLVVDEADKAPTHVTCILKTFVENGEMILSDGRKIYPSNVDRCENQMSPETIYTHPDFRLIVLANRPGFPFLGNDFFASLGDLFSCHSVDNPSTESEIYLLKQYGPNVAEETLRKLVNAFAELRSMADVGQLSYPYSTREVVNIVKHLEKYPHENVGELIANVFDFDRYSPEALEQVTDVLQKHGFAIEMYAKNELAAIRRQKEIQLTVERTSGLSVSAPKHGKEDPNNKPHVGGNTWAGGTGGRDTAGLGGKGGPYRLDKGHKVHQLSDEEKNDVPEYVKKAAREMNRKAFADKLKEIKMSSYDHQIYDAFSAPVRKQVQQLRVILSSLQAKSKERQWLKHQTSGEIDDNKLIEGLVGERNIYRKRGEENPEPGQPQEKPKRLKFVIDVSGSMYRFNGYDQRLDRELEAVVMVMESFEGFETRVRYDIVGHSGESKNILFVNEKNPPADSKMRLETIKMMHAHSQFCWSGDNTVEATKFAIDSLAKEDADESIVIVLSDANLQRYSISPKELAKALTSQEPKVQAYAIFIGSLANEAQLIIRSLPAGRGFVCMDLAELPVILKQIFTSSVLNQTV